jgi:TolB-like protein
MEPRKVLVSWKEIGAYLGRDPRTCQRWQRELGLPIHRMNGSPKARIYAYPDELDRWLEGKLRAPEVQEAGPQEAVTPGTVNVELTPLKILLLIVALTAISLTATILWRFPAAPKPGAGNSDLGQPIIVVPAFENESGDDKLDNWRDGLAELLGTSLSQYQSIHVVPDDQTYTALEELSLVKARKYSSLDVEKIAARVQATYVLRGSFLKTGESFIITASLERPGTNGSPIILRLEARNENEIVPTVDELARKIKAELNLH